MADNEPHVKTQSTKTEKRHRLRADFIDKIKEITSLEIEDFNKELDEAVSYTISFNSEYKSYRT